ncbi:MAG: FHA domain-containing protein [Ilumatobacteraceae bacterium]
MNSTNGCLVNGRRIQGERQLRSGDRVQAGNTVLETRR